MPIFWEIIEKKNISPICRLLIPACKESKEIERRYHVLVFIFIIIFSLFRTDMPEKTNAVCDWSLHCMSFIQKF